MPLLALIGIVLLILGLVHVIPLLLGVILGIVLIVAGGGSYWYSNRGGRL